MISENKKICGVIVTFNPDPDALLRLILAVRRQLTNLVIIDNGSSNDVAEIFANFDAEIKFISLGENQGIAKAQNIGIEWSKTQGSHFVLLLDQDSIPATNMVSELSRAIFTKQSEGKFVACAGPRYTDPRQNNASPFIRTKGLTIRRYVCNAANDILEVDYLIASGCLIPHTTLEAVGCMKEELFIDYVDIEWGLRAQLKGFQSYGVCAAHMEHQLGDKPILFRGRKIPTHSPLRHYYHFRNAVWLYRQPWLRKSWKIVDAIRLVRKFVFYSVVTTPRLMHFKMMCVGILHGMTNRMGRK